MFEQQNINEKVSYISNLEDKLLIESTNRRATIKKLIKMYKEDIGVISFD
jgi:hypothetical protein